MWRGKQGQLLFVVKHERHLFLFSVSAKLPFVVHILIQSWLKSISDHLFRLGLAPVLLFQTEDGQMPRLTPARLREKLPIYSRSLRSESEGQRWNFR